MIAFPCLKAQCRQPPRSQQQRSPTSARSVQCSCTPQQPDSFGLSPQQQLQVDTFLDFLLEENEKYNLTAVRTRSEAVPRHILDSLALLAPIEVHSSAAERGVLLLDVGSGAGLPGCLLAIARPDWNVCFFL